MLAANLFLTKDNIPEKLNSTTVQHELFSKLFQEDMGFQPGWSVGLLMLPVQALGDIFTHIFTQLVAQILIILSLWSRKIKPSLHRC
jgi:hypothetical protein